MTIPLSKIPTVSQLYVTKKLMPLDSDDAYYDDLPEPSQSLNNRIAMIKGDITKLHVDAIVNAANNSLLGGGGVDGAIHAAAGRDLFRECRTLNGCDTGSAKITGAYELPCKKVIHAVGPIYSSHESGESAALLSSCYTTSLQLAVENDCRSIAFSALSTGVYGYPSNSAAPVAIDTVREFLEGKDGDKIDRVVFCTFVDKDVNAYKLWLPRFLPATKQDLIDAAEWETVEAGEGETAENGPAKVDQTAQHLFEQLVNQVADQDTDSKDATTKEEPKEEPSTSKTTSEAPIRAEDLPSVPSSEPADQEEPSAKKLKSKSE